MRTGELPPFARRFVRSGDRCFKLGESHDAPVLVRSDARRRGDLLHARLLLVNRPKEGAASAPWFVRAHLNDGSPLRSIVIEGEALARYFYRSRPGRSETLYSTLGANSDCSPTSLRFAWRMRTAETAVAEDEALRRGCERAFNILANHVLRACYDSFLADDMAMLPFPYGGEGDILVAGDLSKDGSTFFAEACSPPVAQ